MISQSARRSLLPELDRLIDPTGLYCMYDLDEKEIFAKRRSHSLEDTILELENLGYEYHGLSAIKEHPELDILDSGSYRKVPEEHPDVDKQITREYRPEECQYHVHIFDTGDYIELASHYELRPDFFEPDFDIDRLRDHYRPDYGHNYLKGVTSHRVSEL